MVLVVTVYFVGANLFSRFSNIRITGIFSGIFGKGLARDASGHTNFLILGSGGEGHDGADLTDTIIIASLDQIKNSVSLFSIPRDFFVKSKNGGSRINELYTNSKRKWDASQALGIVQQTISETFNIPLHYTVKIDFRAFEKIVDAVDGIDVYVEDTIDDPLYPRDGTYDYEPFFLSKGLQHLDGATALKYARSRKTSSDFDRSRRQHQVIMALKNKAGEKNSYGRKNLIRELYSSLTKNVETNISLREALSLADLATQLDGKNLAAANLNDDPFIPGGFLYTPPRDLYGGAFILLPAGEKLDSVQSFVWLISYGPRNLYDMPISILNGTKRNGLASRLKTGLKRYGFEFSHLGNARDQKLGSTSIYFSDENARPIVDFLQNMLNLPGEISQQIPIEYSQNPDIQTAKIIIELGEDSLSQIEKFDIFRNVVMEPAGSTTQTGTNTPAAEITATGTSTAEN